VVGYLQQHAHALTAIEIARAVGSNSKTIWEIMTRLERQGRAVKAEDHRWQLATAPSNGAH
jgi:DNA-binding IclR family transcriptional regulator